MLAGRCACGPRPAARTSDRSRAAPARRCRHRSRATRSSAWAASASRERTSKRRFAVARRARRSRCSSRATAGCSREGVTLDPPRADRVKLVANRDAPPRGARRVRNAGWGELHPAWDIPAGGDVVSELAPRPRAASATEMLEYVLPQHANIGGTVFGGQIMAWVDLCAAICAQRHAGRPCVTAFVDDSALQAAGPRRPGRAAARAGHRDLPHVDGNRRQRLAARTPSPASMWPTVECRVVFVAMDEERQPDPGAPAAPRDGRPTARPRRPPRSGGARGSPNGDKRAWGHERSAHRGSEQARRRDGHPPGLALQQAVERQAALPRGARRDRHRPVPSSSRATSRRRLFQQADHIQQESSVEVDRHREEAREDRGAVRDRRRRTCACWPRRRRSTPSARRSTGPTS